MRIDDLLPEDFELFDEQRNPNGTFAVAELIWIIDRRPVYLYEECESMSEAIGQIFSQASVVATEVSRHVARGSGDRVCESCGGALGGNRTTRCHSCSRKKWEGQGHGKGGRIAAELETRYHLERETLVERHRSEMAEKERRHTVERDRLEGQLRSAILRAESSERDVTALAILSRMAREDPESEFARAFDAKFKVAAEMAAIGWKKDA